LSLNVRADLFGSVYFLFDLLSELELGSTRKLRRCKRGSQDEQGYNDDEKHGRIVNIEGYSAV